MEEAPGVSDDDLLSKLKAVDGDESQASLATIREAKRWAKAGEKPNQPVKPIDPPEMKLYESVYFGVEA